MDTDRMALANRLFFRLYQCANMLHKTGSRAVVSRGLTTQQWAVLGALSRPAAAGGMSVGDLARYLMVSRQNLSGVIRRLERDGHIASVQAAPDRRVRLVTITAPGHRFWQTQALPRIRDYYELALIGFSDRDIVDALQHLLRLLGNMSRLDETDGAQPARVTEAA